MKEHVVICHTGRRSCSGIFIQYVQKQLGEEKVNDQMKFAGDTDSCSK